MNNDSMEECSPDSSSTFNPESVILEEAINRNQFQPPHIWGMSHSIPMPIPMLIPIQRPPTSEAPLLSTWIQFATEDRNYSLHNLCLIWSNFSKRTFPFFKIPNVNYKLYLKDATIFKKGRMKELEKGGNKGKLLNFNLFCIMESAD